MRVECRKLFACEQVLSVEETRDGGRKLVNEVSLRYERAKFERMNRVLYIIKGSTNRSAIDVVASRSLIAL